ncbi:MAG: hypothetical protein A3C08_01005 [Candidatus Taylorbacteria bacterium RIFCSPHIGHO2_02_FULL_47_18]|uniref:Uncharacterized protein n=1 Tax=Candidatus Taylorbacteria bacterium RIFCSPLOWO2_01_FULL_48_100 TaxID=1802322 RepID=A0A1G2NCG2_9BACT|nr:MAG: hypothetical protein A2670_00425 [Candidatus Taylorbacteria bacterium RIFCSPHIGHO2_01_FULL_48_38]OHA28265.1 MAG: hypothetical protein A3C08_01005 [Candidatus Taylorbacteria bacterium RIFCSPHIGHO2_02_FULL_47_18]OHA33777.1 MAG: hypothetical protein A2938_00515 [Candidatus Taylorbacteria bacterium RIFCSPLOWO2_01_FULL_48_100]OHA40594.1 MAG: hypothetical protein A3J31_02190 [Candidatus Taylorbacteria bacterium RIFCSPLOWO2_02_FULL_48_16]OHA44764.1 MAG: hypothetical protein A3H13_00560 [Candid
MRTNPIVGNEGGSPVCGGPGVELGSNWNEAMRRASELPGDFYVGDIRFRNGNVKVWNEMFQRWDWVPIEDAHVLDGAG